MDINIFYTFEYEDEILDYEFSNKEEVKKYADEWWAEKQEDNEGMRNGETFEDEIFIIAAYYHEETDELIIDEREKYQVEFEYYHGDLKEHGYPQNW